MSQAQEWTRNKLLYHAGAGGLSQGELLGLIIRDEALGEKIIEQFGGFVGLSGQPLEKLQKFSGMGPGRIAQVAACFEIATRIVTEVLSKLQRE